MPSAERLARVYRLRLQEGEGLKTVETLQL